MKLLRNLTWRLVAVAFLLLFAYATFHFLHIESSELKSLQQTTKYASIVAMFIGLIVPTRILKIPETLNHEVGHALMASLLRNTIDSIRVEIDTSGVTFAKGKPSRLHLGLRAIAGPLASATLFAFTTLLVVINHADYWILFTLVSTVLITVTTVRSFWGWISAAIVTTALFRALQLSLEIGSNVSSNLAYGIWFNSQWNIAILITAYSAGIGLRYSWACRRPVSESQDESKVGRALGMSPTVGGYLVLLLNAAITAFSFSIIFN